MAKTIMIIDDSVAIRKVVGLTLKGSGYEVVEAEDGQDALEKLAGREIHLFICDINMPRMDGFAFARQIQAAEEYRDIPIIMLTTETGEDKKKQGDDAGVRAWVTKPFQPQQILSVISGLIA